jgi:hypothetical protein
VRLRLTEAGPRRLAFRVTAQPGEDLLANNVDTHVVRVSDEPARVLHFEGEPRFEVKFLRRALAGDDRLELTSLVRTAENKFYRLGVREPQELIDGFPRDPETLFAYHALVIGSVDAALLDPEQQRMVAEFVSRRGGGVIALGGRRALAEGGHGSAPLASMLPVVLGAPVQGYSAAAALRPTHLGRTHPVLDAVAEGDWEHLPALTVVNPIRSAKAGATVLLEARARAGEALVGLAFHRYGRGLVAALPVRDTWRWQLHPEVALDDPTHERFWRQLLRWVVGPARERLTIETAPAHPTPGQPVEVRIEVLDVGFRPLANAPVTLETVDPLGTAASIAIEPVAGEAGVYRARLLPAIAGLHDLRARIEDPERSASSAEAHVWVTDAGREYHGAGMRDALLARVAHETGGRFVTLDDADELAAELRAPSGGVRVTRRVPLWNSPLLLGLILALACAEWAWRRRRRLA